ncbi:uncharacterized protein N7498_004263 [Penicillium cinerascens]|uniref:FAD dependent oxidoreductase domain-containing protein n=1 Tax=Penicillium cinerascens TaxID=70096 RepID=A0A9W9N3R9_9EURO|nr:uncharacterized protein N7498_004263 [Penicillium cinerascens]KAJ5212617.1 hypothetical protein N7498_004263 [Penicillium cinerascens]
MSQGNIIIIGAGVLGLSTAIQLSRSGHKVTLIARDLPGDSTIDYASPWAGAHFQPSPAKTPAEQLEQQLMQETYRELDAIAQNHPEAGVAFIPAVEYFDSADPDSFLSKENGYINWPDFSIIDKTQYPPNHDIQMAVTYRSWVLNSPVYLLWLQKLAKELGVVIIRSQLTALEDAVPIFRHASDNHVGHISAVIDASGRGFNDPDSYPSRGQFVIVENEFDMTVSHHWADGSSTVVVPRPFGGGTVVGGTKEPGNWSEEISDSDTEMILKRVKNICPGIVGQDPAKENVLGFQIRQVYVARRPMRRGGLRLEQDVVGIQSPGDGRRVPLIHCYGAGQSGYKISWGVAKRVESLIADLK